MSSYRISRCRHDRRISCLSCDINSSSCTVTPVLCDADVILNKYLEDKYTQESNNFINENRHKHKIYVTKDTLGEVTDRIVNAEKTDDQMLPIIQQFISDLKNFNVIDSPIFDPSYAEVFSLLSNNRGLRCGSTDRILIATSLVKNFPFYTFDSGVKGDASTINSILKKNSLRHIFRIYSF